MTTTTLVLGGTQSGMSRHAQSLLPRDHAVTAIEVRQPGSRSDPERSSRTTRDQQERPQEWTTVEATDITRAIIHARSPVLVDDLGSWVTATIDEANLWKSPAKALRLVEEKTAELVALWAWAPYDAVALSHEVGVSLTPQTPAERLFHDALEHVNVSLSAVSQQVYLVIAGRLLDLSEAPAISPPTS
ncbi:bifunctional adenosylcobinamide kinase/adenosylcobinamide-phosphate guanylyltransferase [Demetria terragena]|uniref:bifunctional adenosylcobinamide kinase/adenosylcobinamide-phosphate guanylyltransferase n=1 Tax=Demetria terragena TaxID=63959 RepID=UPI00036012E9|nr:bifunctional adenosylcobinamide kinase/adenosylcobinamide-phosphate guanylyltransferase [Demetria terragena]